MAVLKTVWQREEQDIRKRKRKKAEEKEEEKRRKRIARAENRGQITTL